MKKKICVPEQLVLSDKEREIAKKWLKGTEKLMKSLDKVFYVNSTAKKYELENESLNLCSEQMYSICNLINNVGIACEVALETDKILQKFGVGY